jgi:lipid II:glycine glycyltransferase (peptidoglycan interpeptide bridge formation enzyme)
MVMTIRFGKMTAYYIGASDIHNPKFSPAYLTQRTAILYAKSVGCTSYNFWWVPPDDNPKHPLAGVGLFKRGFGGEDRFFIHAHDLVVNTRKYYLTRVIEKYRAWRRGYYYSRN